MAKSTKGDSFAEKIPVVDGLNRSLLGFNDSLQSLIGTEVPARIDSSASSLSSINSSLEQVLSSDPAQTTSISYTGELDFNIGLPDILKNTVETISETLEGLIGALEAAKTILEALRTLVISLEDALRVLLEEVLSRIERVLNVFKFGAADSVRLLLVPPIIPVPESNGSEPNAIDASIVEGFLQVVDKAYPPEEVESNPIPGGLDRSELRNRLIAYSSKARTATGSAAFLDTINKSFSDKKDFNRPQEAYGWSSGMLIQAGFPAVGDVLEVWSKIQKTLSAGYDKFIKLDPTISPASLEISRVKILGYTEDNTSAQLFVSINNPSSGGSRTGLYPSKIKFAPIITELFALRTYEGVADPNITAALFSDYDSYRDNDFTGLSAVYSEELSVFFDVNLSTLASTPSSTELSSDSLGEPISPGYTYDLRLRSYYVAYELQDDGTYDLYSGDEHVPFTRYYPSVKIAIPAVPTSSAKPLIPTGEQPNWIKYGSNWSIPVFDDLKLYFNRLLEQLRSLLSVASNSVQQVIDLYLLLISKLQGMLQTLLNISNLISKVLKFKLGANIVMFSCNNGASGIKQAIEEYLLEQKSGYESAEEAETDTSSYNWFANGESVCGAVLVVSSQTAEVVDRFFSAMSILFSLEQESSAIPALAVDSGLNNSANIPFGAINAGNTTALFSEALGGLESSDHLLSPENNCG